MLDQVFKTAERVIDSIIRSQVKTDDIQSISNWLGTTGSIFIPRYTNNT